MMLYVNGSEIDSLVLGILNDERSIFLLQPFRFQLSPEEFLGKITQMIDMPGSGQISGIVVVLGPGSATALRSTLAIVNAFAFARSIPIFGVSLEKDADDRTILVALRDAKSIPMARPIYAYAARITASNKDALRR
ncbi:MAG: hypothetical protein WCT28_00815 [Patescibacteria group bacterium]|jgi:hypothetical protein